MRRAWLLLLCAGIGCGAKTPSAASDAGWDGGGELLRQPSLTGTHLSSCDDTKCGNGTNPPLGGDHCASWLPCRRYDTAQPRCNWIHNLEHGHAVLAYNCPKGCDDLVMKLGALWEARQSDANKMRILITPDPLLTHKVAAVVWGYGWVGDDFNEPAINSVLDHQDQEAPEAFLGCSP